MNELVDIGCISSRGQVAIPSGIRKALGLDDGVKVLFVVDNETLVVKKVTAQSFSHITQPLKLAAKKAKLAESQVSDIIHRFRKK